MERVVRIRLASAQGLQARDRRPDCPGTPSLFNERASGNKLNSAEPRSEKHESLSGLWDAIPKAVNNIPPYFITPQRRNEFGENAVVNQLGNVLHGYEIRTSFLNEPSKLRYQAPPFVAGLPPLAARISRERLTRGAARQEAV